MPRLKYPQFNELHGIAGFIVQLIKTTAISSRYQVELIFFLTELKDLYKNKKKKIKKITLLLFKILYRAAIIVF